MTKLTLNGDNLYNTLAPKKTGQKKSPDLRSVKILIDFFNWQVRFPADNMYWDEYGNPVYLDNIYP